MPHFCPVFPQCSDHGSEVVGDLLAMVSSIFPSIWTGEADPMRVFGAMAAMFAVRVMKTRPMLPRTSGAT